MVVVRLMSYPLFTHMNVHWYTSSHNPYPHWFKIVKMLAIIIISVLYTVSNQSYVMMVAIHFSHRNTGSNTVAKVN